MNQGRIIDHRAGEVRTSNCRKESRLFHAEAVLEELKKELIFEKKLKIVAKKQLDISKRNVDRISALVSQGRESKQLSMTQNQNMLIVSRTTY